MTQARPSSRPVNRPTTVGGMGTSRGEGAGSHDTAWSGGTARPPPGGQPAQAARVADEPDLGAGRCGRPGCRPGLPGPYRLHELLGVPAEVGVVLAQDSAPPAPLVG